MLSATHRLITLLALATLGCGAQPEVRYSSDVRPILDARCVDCHQRGGEAPFPLQTYEEARRAGRQLVEVTTSRYMPPWRAAPSDPPFLGERHLTEAEIAALRRWVELEMPQGESTEPIPARLAQNGWAHGEPDMVLQLPSPYRLAADGPDVIRNFVIPGVTTTDRWVEAVEMRPGSKGVVHHAILKVDRSRYSRQRDAAEPGPGFSGMEMGAAESPDGQMIVWAPGTQPVPDALRYAWPLPAGADWVLQLHLLPSGREMEINPEIAVYFSDRPPARRPVGLLLADETLDIPAGEASHRVTQSIQLPVATELLGLFPHAHYLGKQLTIEATLPDGSRRPLLDIPQWDFDWQTFYRYAEPVALPAGTTLAMNYTYDNSAANVRNPNSPPQRVVGGNRSSDEMATLAIQLLAVNESERPQLLLRQFEQRLESRPNDAASHYNLGVLLSRSGDLPNAERHYREAIRLQEQDHFAHYGLAGVLARQRRFAEAQRHYQRAVELQPDFADGHYFLARVLIDQGKTDTAIGSLRRVLQIDPNHLRARQTLDQLERR